jgi:hypothetical protein
VPRTLDEPRLDVSAALRYPFTAGQWPWVAAAMVAGAVIETLSALPVPFIGLVALFLRVVVWLTLYRVASEVLLAGADGRDRPGAGAYATTEGLAVRHVGLWLVGTAVVVAATIQLGFAGTLVVCLLLAALLPAATIVLTLSGSLIQALVPTQWIRLVQRIGRDDYARLFAVLLAAAIGYLLLSLGLAALAVPDAVRHPIVLAFWAAAMLAWFRLAGRAVWLHREELGLDEADTEPETAPETFTRDPDALWTEIRERGGTRAMHAELARQLERAGDRETRLAHGRMHVEALLAAFEDPVEAVDRAHRMLSVDPDFVLGDPRATLALIRAAAEQDAGALTARLVDNYLAAFPNSSKRNEARLVGCEALQHAPTDAREPGRRWFRELMTAELDEAQRERLAALRRTYLGASADGSPSAG